METQGALSPREAALRATTSACLAGTAAVQAIELPSLLAQGRQLAALSVALMALCVGSGWALSVASAGAGRRLWRVVAATAALALGGWAAPQAFPVPDLAGAGDHWVTAPAAGLAAICLALALVAAGGSVRALGQALAGTAALLCLMAGTAVAALTPGLTHAAILAHHGAFENSIEFRPGSGRHGNHFVVPADVVPQQTAFGVALVIAAALLFVYGAVGALRRRTVSPATTATTTTTPVRSPVAIETGMA